MQGWQILKENNDFGPSTQILYNGIRLAGVQSVSFEVMGDPPYVILNIKVMPIDGIVVDVKFDPIQKTSPEVFHSNQTPEEILENIK